MDVLLGLARVLLGAVFAVAGLAKMADRKETAKTAVELGAPAALGPPVALVLPFLELAFAAALIPVATAWWGAAGVLFLLFVFMLAISVSLARGRKPDCRCFGQLHSKPIGWTTLLRNGALALLAVIIVARGPNRSGPSVLDWSVFGSLPGTVVALLIALTVLVAFELFMLFHLLRQNGRLILRIEALEKGGARGAPPVAGLPVGSEAPAFTVVDLEGNTVSLGTLVGRGALLLFFSEPGCGACDAALPEVARWQREHASRLAIVPFSRGDVSVNQAKATKHGLDGLLLQTDQDVAELYLVNATPSAVLIKDGMIASPLAMGIDAIRELVTNATLPPPLKKGDEVPSLKLPDLTGSPVDLAELRGQRTLLVFWNPSCGFCQRMLGDLKAWETTRAEAAPELLVISVGSRQANRGQGFRSRVVLDHKSVAGRLFGSTGTPSAVLVDEIGRVASDVGIGADEVFALAGRKTASEPIPA